MVASKERTRGPRGGAPASSWRPGPTPQGTEKAGDLRGRIAGCCDGVRRRHPGYRIDQGGERARSRRGVQEVRRGPESLGCTWGPLWGVVLALAPRSPSRPSIRSSSSSSYRSSGPTS